MNIKKFLNKNFFLFGLIILSRIILTFLPSFKIDMRTYQAWAGRLVEVTPINFYAPNYFADYFPGYLYLLYFLGLSFNFLFPHLTVFSQQFEIYLKAFTNLFDIATAFYIYKIVQKYQKNLAKFAAILYLINPALAFNSSIWGQVDGILTFFLIFSAYNLVELKNTFRFNLVSALSILVKPQGLAIFPILLIYHLKNFSLLKNLNLFMIPFILIILSLPFFLKDPILGLFHLFQKSAGTYPYTSMFSYNFWSFAGWWIPDSKTFFGITFQLWGVILFLVFLTIILIPLIIKRGSKDIFLVYFASALSIFAFFLFLTRIHQRYLFPFFAFLLIVSLLKKSWKLLVIYFILTAVHLLNLWFVYYYYNYVFENPQFSSFPLYQFLNSTYNYFTVTNLVGFGILMVIYYRSYAKKIP